MGWVHLGSEGVAVLLNPGRAGAPPSPSMLVLFCPSLFLGHIPEPAQVVSSAGVQPNRDIYTLTGCLICVVIDALLIKYKLWDLQRHRESPKGEPHGWMDGWMEVQASDRQHLPASHEALTLTPVTIKTEELIFLESFLAIALVGGGRLILPINSS